MTTYEQSSVLAFLLLNARFIQNQHADYNQYGAYKPLEKSALMLRDVDLNVLDAWNYNGYSKFLEVGKISNKSEVDDSRVLLLK